jgi:hypothetical protein
MDEVEERQNLLLPLIEEMQDQVLADLVKNQQQQREQQAGLF